MNAKYLASILTLSICFAASGVTTGENHFGKTKVEASPSVSSAPVSGMKMVKIPAGKTADLGLYVNSTGVVNMIIKTRDGTDEVPEMWWITWGFGTNVSLGKKKGSFHTPVPVNLLKGIISAKLRVRAGPSDTVVYLSTSGVAPAGGVTFQW